MSLIKLANKLTKMYNTLSEAAQQKAAPLLRSEGRFVKGIEKGNRRLLSELQKYKKQSFKFTHSKGVGEEFFDHNDHNNLIFNVKKYPKTLDDAIGKRHEIFEAQQVLKVKGLSKELKKFDIPQPDFEKNIDILRNKKNNIIQDYLKNKDNKPNKSDRVFKAIDYLDSKISKNFVGAAMNPKVKDKFYSHYNPQVLVNESKLMNITPRSHNTDMFKYRHKSGEVQELRNRFKFDYGK
jgi:hypothetical protein